MISHKDFGPHGRTTLPLYGKLVVDPLARLIALPLVNFTNIKPYQVTLAGLGLGLYSAFLFYEGAYLYAALAFQITVVLDMVDGYVARIKSSGSVGGILLDGYADILRTFLNVLALAVSIRDDSALRLLLMSFLFLSAAEALIDLELGKRSEVSEWERESDSQPVRQDRVAGQESAGTGWAPDYLPLHPGALVLCALPPVPSQEVSRRGPSLGLVWSSSRST